MNLNIKQRIKLVERQIEERRPKLRRPGIVLYDANLSPKKYYVDEKEFTEAELKIYMEQFEDQDSMTIFKPRRPLE